MPKYIEDRIPDINTSPMYFKRNDKKNYQNDKYYHFDNFEFCLNFQSLKELTTNNLSF